MGLSDNLPIPRNLIPQSPVLVFRRNPQAEHHPLKSFFTWCCCIFCGFIFFLFLVSLGAKKDLEQDKLSLAYEGREYESRHFPRPLGTINYSTRTTVEPVVRNTVKPTVSRNETVPELTKKNTCSTSTCKNLAGLMKSLIKDSTPPCQDFYEHACGNTQDFQNYLNQIQIDNFHEKFKESFNEVANFLEKSPKNLIMPSERNLKKVFQKCLKRENRDVEDLMKALTEEFKWPFHEKEKYKRNIYVVNHILSKLIKLNPKALQLFEVVGKDKQLIIRPSFCHGKHDPIDTNALQVIFNIISKNPESDMRKLLENSLHIALEVDKAREYCTEISPPTHHKNEFDVDFDRSHIDFIQIFQLEKTSPEEILSHLNFTDSYEIFQKDSFLNKLLDYHSIGIAHYLVIKYLEDISTKLLLPDKEHCAMIAFQMMPDAFLSIYENHILRPENSETIPDFISSLKSEYLELASESSKLEGEKDKILTKVKEFDAEIGRIGRTIDIPDNDTFYTVFTRLNSHSFEEFSQHVFFKNHNSSRLSFNEKILPSVMFFQILAVPLYDSKYPLAVQYGRAGHDVAVSMAIELGNAIDLHPKCMNSESTEYLAMRAAWNGFQSATKSKSSVKLPGLESIPHEQIFFYSMVQPKCQEEEGRRVNNVLKEMKEFRGTFGCPLMEKSRSCEPFL